MVGGNNQVEDIVIVDDAPAEIRFIDEAFSGSHFDDAIHAAMTKEEALDFVKQQGEYGDAPAPEVILLDWHLAKDRTRSVRRGQGCRPFDSSGGDDGLET